MSNLPRWYVPAGADASAHFARFPCSRLLDGVGPDEAGGGLVYGGSFVVGESGWQKTTGGWWVNFSGVLPQNIMRMDLSPRVREWAPVLGHDFNHWWSLPVLLRPVCGEDGAPRYFVSALDRIWSNDGWADPVDLAALQNRIRNVAQNVCGENIDEKQLIDLVCDLIKMGHNIESCELVASGFISFDFALRVIVACASIPICSEQDDGQS